MQGPSSRDDPRRPVQPTRGRKTPAVGAAAFRSRTRRRDRRSSGGYRSGSPVRCPVARACRNLRGVRGRGIPRTPGARRSRPRGAIIRPGMTAGVRPSDGSGHEKTPPMRGAWRGHLSRERGAPSRAPHTSKDIESTLSCQEVSRLRVDGGERRGEHRGEVASRMLRAVPSRSRMFLAGRPDGRAPPSTTARSAAISSRSIASVRASVDAPPRIPRAFARGVTLRSPRIPRRRTRALATNAASRDAARRVQAGGLLVAAARAIPRIRIVHGRSSIARGHRIRAGNSPRQR